MNFLVFAIHTVPDTDTGIKKYNLGDLDAKNSLKAIMHLHQQSGNKELPHYMRRIVAISTIFRGEGVTLDINTFGDVNGEPTDVDSEARLLKQFFSSINSFKVPAIISWDSTKNDIPILMYRCLKHNIPASLVLANQPLSLINAISNYQYDATTSQENVMTLLGLDYIPELTTKQVWKYWGKGNADAIKSNCTFKALNSYRIYLRYQLITGMVTQRHFDHESVRIERLVKEYMDDRS